MIDTEILIGDVVELSPTKMATVSDFDLEKCTVLEIDRRENRIKVVFNNDNSDNEHYFDVESSVDWFSARHVINIERDYKVISLTDSQDTITGQEACLVKMARVSKTAFKMSGSYTLASNVNDESVIDHFIMIGFTADELRDLEGTTNRLSFAQYKVRWADIDHMPVKLWQPKIDINEPGDIFTMLDVA